MLHYGMTSAGHYLDHCRGSFSAMDNEVHLKVLWKLISANKNDRQFIRKCVLQSMVATEFEQQPVPASVSLQKACWGLQNRFEGEFTALSHDFEQSNKVILSTLKACAANDETGRALLIAHPSWPTL
jgi:hypothetical protein